MSAYRTTAIAQPSVGLGASAKTVLRTSFQAIVTSAATGIWTGFLEPGSCFSPGGSLSAVQPVTFDQFSTVYGRYKVNSAIVKIAILGANSGGSFTYVAASYPSVDTTAVATYQGAASQPWAKTVLGGFQYGAGGGQAGGAQHTVMIHKLNQDGVVGSKSDSYDSGALVTADPTALQYMVLPIYIKSDSAFVGTFVITVDMWQNVTFSQRKPVVDA